VDALEPNPVRRCDLSPGIRLPLVVHSVVNVKNTESSQAGEGLDSLLAVPFYRGLWNRRAAGSLVRTRVLVIGMLFLLSAPTNWLLGVEAFIPFSYGYALLMFFETWHALWAVNYVYAKTRAVIDSVAPHIQDEANLIRAFNRTYSNRNLLRACFGCALFFTSVFLAFGLRLPWLITSYIALWVAIVGFFGALGIWEGFASLMLFKALLPAKTDAYFILAPGRSSVVEEVSQLFVQYSVVYAVETLPFAIGFAGFSYSTKALSGAGRMAPNSAALLLAMTILMAFLVYVLTYFLVPQWMLSSRVRQIKRRFLGEYQDRINLLLGKAGGALTDADLKTFQMLREAEEKINGSPALPLSILDVAKMLLPLLASLGAVFSDKDRMKTVQSAARTLFPWL
jgi:hypothetical protein